MFGETAALAAAAGDDFAGTSRKASKLSIPDGPVKKFADLKDLMDSLPDDQDMIHHQPPIKDNATSRRTAEEKRNVRVDVFLYAASREDDNDFHLIIGRDPDAEGDELYMTAELSGLPPAGSPSSAKLKAARKSFKDFFADDLPGSKYDFYDPPIPVQIEGPIFFDITHAHGGRPGPKSLRAHMPTIWEIHAISKITFDA